MKQKNRDVLRSNEYQFCWKPQTVEAIAARIGRRPQSSSAGLIDVHLLIAAMAVAVTVADTPPAAAHPGSEPHPTVEELQEVAAELRSVINETDRRLSERIDDLDMHVTVPDKQTVTNTVQLDVGDAVVELVKSSNELKDWVEGIAVLGAALLAGLTSVSAVLGFRVRALRKVLSRSLQQAGADPTDLGEQEDVEDKDQSAEKRIVTHTLKERISSGMQPTIRELHNPDTEWSPRTVEEAIADIDRGIQYWARSPGGHEAEIEVRQGRIKRHLRTKPDKHGGNNLGELPDP